MTDTRAQHTKQITFNEEGTVAECNGHEFDALDMTWTCACGEALEPDAHNCPECGALNPFLGVLI